MSDDIILPCRWHYFVFSDYIIASQSLSEMKIEKSLDECTNGSSCVTSSFCSVYIDWSFNLLKVLCCALSSPEPFVVKRKCNLGQKVHTCKLINVSLKWPWINKKFDTCLNTYVVAQIHLCIVNSTYGQAQVPSGGPLHYSESPSPLVWGLGIWDRACQQLCNLDLCNLPDVNAC